MTRETPNAMGAATGDEGRRAAAEMLDAILRRGRTPAEAFGGGGRARRDSGLARMLVLTTLRRMGQIDAFLAGLMARPLPPRRGRVQDLLRLGVCQLVYLSTPAHAAVDRTVALANTPSLSPYRGLLNAVLRRAAREIDAIEMLDAPRVNTPDWLWDSWRRAYGDAQCRAIAETHLKEPPLDVSVAADGPAWAERLGGALLPNGSLRLRAAGAVENLPGYDAGAWWVQDAAAALPVRLLGPLQGRQVVEIGAAPGGKTAQLAAGGARTTAVERSRGRAALLATNLARLGLDAEIVEADARTWRPERSADAVLLDAPCSATGTIRRHPDIPRLRTPADLTRLSALQGKLLAAAAEMTAPGGLLVYAACSLQPEECEERVESFLAAGRHFKREPVRVEEIGGLADALSPAGDLRTLPCHLADSGGMDGFYAARLRRTG